MHKDKSKQIRCKVNHKRYLFANLGDACKHFGLPYNHIWSRIHRNGWSVDKALSTPIKEHKPHKYTPHPDVVKYHLEQALERIP